MSEQGSAAGTATLVTVSLKKRRAEAPGFNHGEERHVIEPETPWL